jgi:ribosomal protein S18 acetylase RimI-like enzyme
MTIDYRVNAAMTVEQFIDLLTRSTLGERRPIDDRACMEGMVNNANLTVTAWDGDRLVGVARSVTDFCYACYLSDLAVDAEYQHRGIGKTLVDRTQDALGPRCKIRLLSAPAATGYYPKIGFVHNPNCWEIGPKK